MSNNQSQPHIFIRNLKQPDEKKRTNINWNWRFAYALDKINYLLGKGAKITLQSSKTELHAFLQSLPPQFEPLVKAIQSKI